MKNLFKVLSVLLVLGLALAACTPAAPETSEPAVEDEVLQVAFVTPSTINDLAFNLIPPIPSLASASEK